MARPNSPLVLFLVASVLLCFKLEAINAHVFDHHPNGSAKSPSAMPGPNILPNDPPQEASPADDLLKYIIHVHRPEGRLSFLADQWKNFYKSLLERFLAQLSENGEDTPVGRLLHSYRNVITGFAAWLSAREVEAMKKFDWFVHAYPDRDYDLLTTHTPEFLGLRQPRGGKAGRLWEQSNMGEGIIIGVLDSGVTPGHPSFADRGMPPPPAKWKGRCDFNGSVCNNKLIGARSFISSRDGPDDLVVPPIDEGGHGTHTSSTAAGSPAEHAEALGAAKGMATGMAPRAHLAIYQVCDKNQCAGTDILSALDAAIDDGVDVLSLSFGTIPAPFHSDPVAIGAFAAIKKGIFVSCSAGNSGPRPSTLSSEVPWVLSVAATTTDRTIKATVRLGDGQEFDGESLTKQQGDSGSNMSPLVWAGDSSVPNASLCLQGSFDEFDVKGKVVVCERGGSGRLEKGYVVQNAGGVGMILMNQELDGYSALVDAHLLPASHVAYAHGSKIKDYIKSTNKPTASIVFKGTSFKEPHAPAVTSFSSRGPSKQSPGILKPDISGPGVSILAAWPFPVGEVQVQPAKPEPGEAYFSLESGTSMSCPHLSGVAALLKKLRPAWSPAAIKSALMTTAYVKGSDGQPVLDERFLPAGFFAMGAGHVDPNKAMDPGLVYDIAPDDYIPYLCGLGFSDSEVRIVAHDAVSCMSVKSIPEGDLNYPSISASLAGDNSSVTVFTRTVTNVGEANEAYTAEINAPEGTSVSVKPATLSFTQVNQKLKFEITLNSTGGGSGTVEGELKWVSAKHVVRSPISVTL